MVPEAPTTQPWVASTKATPNRSWVVPLARVTQVAPPSTVDRIVPASPTTQPRVASTKATPRKVAVTRPGETSLHGTAVVAQANCMVHTTPPLVVAAMLPPSPTTCPREASVNETPNNLEPKRGSVTVKRRSFTGYLLHVSPPLVVVKTIRPSPTA